MAKNLHLNRLKSNGKNNICALWISPNMTEIVKEMLAKVGVDIDTAKITRQADQTIHYEIELQPTIATAIADALRRHSYGQFKNSDN